MLADVRVGGIGRFGRSVVQKEGLPRAHHVVEHGRRQDRRADRHIVRMQAGRVAGGFRGNSLCAAV
ncbi:hypothetical protein D3C87_1113090 [compost metagenome]